MSSLRYSMFAALALITWTIVTAPGSADAQVVQLPTFQFFTVNTSVLVPDRGGAYMGGISRAQSSQVSRGVPLVGKLPGAGRLFGNEGLASSRSTSGVSVSATIIDNAELDRAVLAAAGPSIDPTFDPAIASKASFLASNLARQPAHLSGAEDRDQPAGHSVAELRLANDLAQRQREADLRQWLQRGHEAELAGKLGAARTYYKTAARNAPDPLRRQILAYVEHELAVRTRASAVARPQP